MLGMEWFYEKDKMYIAQNINNNDCIINDTKLFCDFRIR